MNIESLAAPEKGENRRYEHERIHVIVSYAAAVRPYNTEVAETTTVGEIKTATLKAFGLQETPTKIFKLFHGGTELTNMGETVGQVAHHHKELALKLEEVIIQG